MTIWVLKYLVPIGVFECSQGPPPAEITDSNLKFLISEFAFSLILHVLYLKIEIFTDWVKFST